MKIHRLSFIAIAAGFLIQAAVAYDIQISTNRFGVLFEETSISEALRAFIVADVQRCYNAWGTNVVVKPNLPVRHGSYIRARVFMGPYYVENPSAPEVEFPEDIVTNSLGQLSLSISTGLIQKYTDALAFKTNNLDKVQAADAFVDFLSSPEFAHVTSNEVANYILYKDLPPEGYLLSGEGIVKDLTSQEFHRPSILGFYHSPNGPDPTNLCVLVTTIKRIRTPSSCFHAMPAIWHDGKWKINMWGWVP